MHTIIVMFNLKMGHLISIPEASIVARVHVLIRCLIVSLDFKMTANCNVFFLLESSILGLVNFRAIESLAIVSKHLIVVTRRRAHMRLFKMGSLHFRLFLVFNDMWS